MRLLRGVLGRSQPEVQEALEDWVYGTPDRVNPEVGEPPFGDFSSEVWSELSESQRKLTEIVSQAIHMLVGEIPAEEGEAHLRRLEALVRELRNGSKGDSPRQIADMMGLIRGAVDREIQERGVKERCEREGRAYHQDPPTTAAMLSGLGPLVQIHPGYGVLTGDRFGEAKALLATYDPDKQRGPQCLTSIALALNKLAEWPIGELDSDMIGDAIKQQNGRK